MKIPPTSPDEAYRALVAKWCPLAADEPALVRDLPRPGAHITWQHVHDAAKTLGAKLCAVCHGECEEGSQDDRWHWGPDGLHCHFRCEAEFRKRYLGQLQPPGALYPRINNRVRS